MEKKIGIADLVLLFLQQCPLFCCFYNSVRWLNRGSVVEKSAAVLPRIMNVVRQNERPVAQLENTTFLTFQQVESAASR